MLLRNPGFTAAAAVCLALGIGATTAIFSVVNAVVLKPLPYRDSAKLVRLYSEFPEFHGGKGLGKFWISGPEFKELRRDLRSFDSLDAWSLQGVNLGANEPVRVTAAFVTGTLLRSLGVPPARGRVHTAEDDVVGVPRNLVISHGLWQRAFGGNPNILGRKAKINGADCTVVGVMPPGFHFPPGEPDPPEVWAPLQIEPTRGRSNHFLHAIGRLKPDRSLEQARQDIGRVVNEAGQIGTQKMHVFHPKNHPVVAFSMHEETVGGVRRAMIVVLAAVGFVLLIASLNVANLLLARSESRRREIAVRRALGADTRALLRQFLIEGTLLAGVGAVLGLGLAFLGLRLLLRIDPASIPRVDEIGIDWRVLGFTALVSAATGIFFGLAPLAQVTAARVGDALKAAAGRVVGSVEGAWMRKVMVAGELALALVLLIGAGLMVRAFWKLQAVDIGLRPENVVTMRIALPGASYPSEQVAPFYARLEDRLNAIPGVTSATVMSGLPPLRDMNANDTEIEGFVPKPGGPTQNLDYYQVVGPRFFETVGVRLVEGRFLDRRDGPGATPSAVVNRTMAETFYPGQSPLGRRVRPSGQKEWWTIVGVVGDVKNAGVDKPAGTEVFVTYQQIPARTMWVALRTAGDPMSAVNEVRRELRALDPTLPVAQVRTLDTVVASAQARPRFLTLLLTLFSAVALGLAAVGIYGVISYSVAQRTNEFGIRMAMGAQGRDVLGMVVGQGLRLGAAGVAAGAAGALLLTRFLRGMLFGIDSLDPATFIAMAAVLGGVAVIAAFIPALRATRVDPIVALRYE
jgi:putative ABC transport system permease protein